MRLSGTKTGAVNQYRGLGNQLWDLAGNRPSLDLPFSDTKSLVDATTGTNLIDFSRASSGTYVGSDGLIKTATTNLLLRSEEFDNAAWSGVGLLAFGSGSIADAIQAPNGAQTADFIVEDATLTTHGVYQEVSTSSGATISFSVYVKAGGKNFCRLVIRNSASASDSAFCFYDLANGTAGSPSVGGTGIQNGASIQAMGNGWYRCSLVGSVPTATTYRLDINTATSISNAFYTGDGTSGIYIWGAQLEQSSTVGEYIPTTSTINSAPRFDHDPTTGESLGLLVEESRTNLLLQSEEFDTTWSLSNINAFGSGSTANATQAPDGNLTADLVTETLDASNTQHTVVQGANVSSGNVYTISLFAKLPVGSTRQLQILIANTNFTVTPAANFDLISGSVASSSNCTASIVPYPNGWYRLIITTIPATSSGLNGFNFRFYDGSSNSNSYIGDGTSGIYIWGAQLEEGSFPTSYIPTVGAGVITPGYTTPAVTRAADVASISGSAFASFYNQTEGTIFAEGSSNSPSSPHFAEVSDGTISDRVTFGYLTQSLGGLVVRNSGSIVAQLYPSVSSVNRKVAYSFATDAYAACAEGGNVLSASSGTLYSSMSEISIGSNVNNATFSVMNGTISRLTYWPSRLPNETLQTITN